MSPRSGFIVKGSSARSIIPLLDRSVFHPQERLDDASTSGLRRCKDELRIVNSAAVIGSGEVYNRGITNGGANYNGDDENDAASNHLVPLSGFKRDLSSVSGSAYPTIRIHASQRQRQIPGRPKSKTKICHGRNRIVS